jgi:ATP-dependent DNA helicase RecQ
LVARAISATYLASALPCEEIGRRLAALRRGAVRVVYAAPERLAGEELLAVLGAVPL